MLLQSQVTPEVPFLPAGGQKSHISDKKSEEPGTPFLSTQSLVTDIDEQRDGRRSRRYKTKDKLWKCHCSACTCDCGGT